MAAPYGPDVVGTARQTPPTATMGDHGGHTRQIQEIPMIFYGPGLGVEGPSRESAWWTSCRRSSRRWASDFDADDLDGEAVNLKGFGDRDD